MKYNEIKFIELIKLGVFEIDIYGRIWRCKTKGGRNGVYTNVPKYRAESKSTPGYLKISAYFNGKRICVFAHRLIYHYFCKGIPKGFVINHIDHNKTNNTPENLEAVSQQKNVKKSYEYYSKQERML